MPAKKAKNKATKQAKKKTVKPKKAKKTVVTKKKTTKSVKKTVKKAVKTTKPAKIEKNVKSGKLLYYFGDGKAEGNGKMKDTLGGKGAGLAEMTNTGVPVPPGFTITTETCKLFYENGMEMPKKFEADMAEYVAKL
jgi:pyruvate,orthophosphate dikinase